MIEVKQSLIDIVKRKLSSVNTPLGWAVANNEFPERHIRRVLGYTSAVNSSATVTTDVTTTNADVPLPTVATAMEIISSSANDDGAPVGTGALTVEIHGLDAQWREISEIALMNGTTKVALVNSYIRINNAHVKTVGTNGTAVGNINIVDQATSAIVYYQIGAGQNMGLQCHFTIPANHRGFITGWCGGSSKASVEARMVLRVKSEWGTDELGSVFNTKDLFICGQGSVDRHFDVPIIVPQKSDLKVSANASGANAWATAAIDFWYEAI